MRWERKGKKMDAYILKSRYIYQYEQGEKGGGGGVKSAEKGGC